MKRLLLAVLFLHPASELIMAQAAPPLTAGGIAAKEKFEKGFPPLLRGLRPRGGPQESRGVILTGRGPVPDWVAPESRPAATSGAASPAPQPQPIPQVVAKVQTKPATFLVDASAGVSFDSIHFERNSATVIPEAREILRGIASGLMSRPSLRILVEGHTCDLGEEDYNNRLSCVRAGAVCAWLRHYEVPDSQLQPIGRGESALISMPNPALSDSSNEPLRRPNRRVWFRQMATPPS